MLRLTAVVYDVDVHAEQQLEFTGHRTKSSSVAPSSNPTYKSRSLSGVSSPLAADPKRARPCRSVARNHRDDLVTMEAEELRGPQ